MKQNSFDNIIQQKADGHRAPVPPDAWANIERMKKRKRRPAAFWWLLGIVLLTGLGIYGWYAQKNKAAGPGSNSAVAGSGAGGNGQLKTVPVNSPNENKLDTTADVVTSTPAGGPIAAAGKNEAVNATTGNSIANNKNSKTITAGAIDKNNTGITTNAGSNNNAAVKTIATLHPSNKTHTNKSILATGDLVTTTTSIRSSRKQKNNAGKAGIKITAASATGEDEAGFASSTSGYKKQWKHSKQKSKTRISVGTTEAAPAMTAEDSTVETSNRVPVTAIPLAALGKKKADGALRGQKLALPLVQYSNTPAQQKQKDSRAKKYSWFVDAAITGFVPVQQADELLSISRTTITPANKAVFIATGIKATPQAAVGYSLAVRKQLSPKVFIGTGLQYTVVKESVWLSGTETNTDYSFIKRLQSNSGGSFLVNDTVATTTTGTRTITATNSYQFISIPLFVQYKLSGNKLWALNFTGGIYANFSSYKNSIAGKLQQLYAGSGSTGNQQTKLGFDLFAGIRLARRIGSRYQLYAEPTLQYNMVKYNMRNMIDNKYIHKAGLSFGLSYAIGK